MLLGVNFLFHLIDFMEVIQLSCEVRVKLVLHLFDQLQVQFVINCIEILTDLLNHRGTLFA